MMVNKDLEGNLVAQNNLYQKVELQEMIIIN